MKPLVRSTRSRGVLLLAAAVPAVVLLSSCSSSSSSGGAKGGGASTSGGGSSGGSVTIASVQDITGANSFNGGGAQAGVLTAVHEINAAGGIDGHQIKVKTYDTTSVVATSQSVIRDATTAKPAVIVGALQSTESTGSATVISSGQVPWLTATYPTEATNNVSYWFTSSPTGKGVAGGTVAGLKQLLGGSLQGKKIAFQGLTAPAVDANLAAIKTAIEADGGSVGPIIRDPITLNSWTSQAATVTSAHADGIIVNTNEPGSTIVAKALGVAGFKGPIITTEGANSDSLLSAVNLPNFYVTRETVTPKQGDPLYAAAVSAGQKTDAVGNPYFAKEYADVYVAKAVLEKCGIPCAADKFASTLKGLGPITIPNGALAGPLNYASSQSGLTAAQIWAWDPSAKAAVSKTDVLPITNS